MASLTGNLVAETYKALLKTIDNDILTASEKQITDGFGGGSNVFIDSNGFLRANKYKVTGGLATQFLKADGSLDTNTYLTSITSSQIIAALGFTPVTNARTLTINGTTYDLSANRSWTIAGTSAVWGNITGTLSNQTDLQTALNAKFNNPTGTISQYIRGDGSIATFPTLPGGLPIGGTTGQILAKIDTTDYNTHWIDNFATQTKNEVKLGQTLTKGTAVYVSSANGTNIIVSAASNTTEALSSKTFGLLETGGATNALVKCVTFGLLAGLDTSTATAGDPVWLGVNGALIFGLANKPFAPAHLVYIGVVTRVQQNNGEIFVNVQNGFELKELHDVAVQTPSNNDGLFYESATSLWKNKSIATVLGYTPQAQLNGTGFVKASGTTISYDNSTYLTTGDAASTYQRLDKMVSNLLASSTEYPNSNAVLAKLALKADAANPVFTGDMTISGIAPKLYFTDTDNNPDYTIFVDSGYFYIYDQTAGATKFQITPSGNAINAGTLTSASFIKSGGTSSQYLMADGSVSALIVNPVTGSGTINYLPKWTSASGLGNSAITDNGTDVSLISRSLLVSGIGSVQGYALSGDFGPNYTIGFGVGMPGTSPNKGINIGYNNVLDFGFIGVVHNSTAWKLLVLQPIGGNVGIGTNSDAGFRFDVSGTGRYSGQLTLNNNILFSSASETKIGWGGITTAGAPNPLIYSDNNFLAINSKAGSRLYFNFDNTNASSFVDFFAGKVTIDKNGASTFASSITAEGRIQVRGGGAGTTEGGYLINNVGDGSSRRWLLLNDYNVFGDFAILQSTTQTGSTYTAPFYINANGNIGINSLSTNIAGYGGAKVITIQASIQPIIELVGSTYNAGDVYGGGAISFRNTSAAVGLIGAENKITNQGELVFYTNNGTTFAKRMTIDPNGNLGIGTASPSGQLSGTKGLSIVNATNAALGLSNGTNNWLNYLAGTQYRFWNNSSSEIIVMHLNGNISIGSSTTDAGYKLDVNGTGRFTTNVNIGTYLSLGTGSGKFLAVGGAVTAGSSADLLMYNTGGNLIFWATGAVGLSIAGTSGTATFSNSIFVNSTATILYSGLSGDFGAGYTVGLGVGYSSSVSKGINMGWSTAFDMGFIGTVHNGQAWKSLSIVPIAGSLLVGMASDTGEKLQVQGAGKFTGSVTATSFFESSDSRLKKLIDGSAQIAGIENLQAKLYEKNGKIEFGYFAQDAQEFMPYSVEKNMDGFLTLSYREVHTAKIARLEQRVAELEKQLNAA